jgi:hypothetical protein
VCLWIISFALIQKLRKYAYRNKNPLVVKNLYFKNIPQQDIKTPPFPS